MLARTLFRTPRQEGLHVIQRREPGGAAEITTMRLRLPAGGRASYRSADEEAVLVLQEGSGTLAAGGRSWHVSRRNVFEEKATGLYVPPGTELTVTAEAPLEGVLFSTPAAGGGEAALVGPDQVKAVPRGRDHYTRTVHDIFVTDPHVRRLMVGETFNPPGHWSSYPPHKHDGRNGEPKLEELYYYRVDPPQGFGHQTLYTAEGEAVTHMVRDGDAVLLPYGYHPVACPPGYRLYYLWALAGEQRKLALYEDPDHTWVHLQD